MSDFVPAVSMYATADSNSPFVSCDGVKSEKSRGDRAGRRPADVRELVLLRQLEHRAGIDDAAGDATLHHEIALFPHAAMMLHRRAAQKGESR